MSGAELHDLLASGAVWTGLLFMIVRSGVAVYGTRAQRAQEKGWSELNDRLKEMARIYEDQLDRIADIHEAALIRDT